MRVKHTTKMKGPDYGRVNFPKYFKSLEKL